jgi:hypothetical protein
MWIGVNEDQVSVYSAFYTLTLIQCQHFFKEHDIVTYVQQQTEAIYWKICGTWAWSLEIWTTLSRYSKKICPQDIRDSNEEPSSHSLPINDLEKRRTYRNNIGGRKCVFRFSQQLLLTVCFTVFNNYWVAHALYSRCVHKGKHSHKLSATVVQL